MATPGGIASGGSPGDYLRGHQEPETSFAEYLQTISRRPDASHSDARSEAAGSTDSSRAGIESPVATERNEPPAEDQEEYKTARASGSLSRQSRTGDSGPSGKERSQVSSRDAKGSEESGRSAPGRESGVVSLEGLPEEGLRSLGKSREEGDAREGERDPSRDPSREGLLSALAGLQDPVDPDQSGSRGAAKTQAGEIDRAVSRRGEGSGREGRGAAPRDGVSRNGLARGGADTSDGEGTSAGEKIHPGEDAGDRVGRDHSGDKALQAGAAQEGMAGENRLARGESPARGAVEPLSGAVTERSRNSSGPRDGRVQLPSGEQLATGNERARSRRSGESRDQQGGHQDRDALVREMVVNLSEESAGEDSSPSPEGRDFSVRLDTAVSTQDRGGPSVPEATATLARRLNGSLGDSIVRQAEVMMKDADRAEIRLVIRPPELGRVRIQLQMEQGHIAGRILVDNQSVRQVVEQNLAALERAFAEAGLEMGSLEVSSGDARQQGDQTARGKEDRETGSSRREVAEALGKSVQDAGSYDYGLRRINLVA
ncbi:hypothetical protein AU468_02595 [Alkalispirochaeta sphaeroplastigenens]|uniref:Flagellar hook-length control protein-like C-terminal domain-containing protein n=2 Tax=Alkalispirochaeta sphaeroplastigenens TaxID=1187066 RepID=A0A2S4JYZ0_9SPIO|nr:hypothetical protein AU468_02595 [Alkalispirochaeta sphaeroplastigenens]